MPNTGWHKRDVTVKRETPGNWETDIKLKRITPPQLPLFFSHLYSSYLCSSEASCCCCLPLLFLLPTVYPLSLMCPLKPLPKRTSESSWAASCRRTRLHLSLWKATNASAVSFFHSAFSPSRYKYFNPFLPYLSYLFIPFPSFFKVIWNFQRSDPNPWHTLPSPLLCLTFLLWNNGGRQYVEQITLLHNCGELFIWRIGIV